MSRISIVVLGACVSSACAASLPPPTTAKGTSVAAFADSTGFEVAQHADPDLMSNRVQVVPDQTTLLERFNGENADSHAASEAERIGNAFVDWCKANGGRFDVGVGVDHEFDVASREYLQQLEEKKGPLSNGFLTSSACTDASNQVLGAYLNLGNGLVAFYDPRTTREFMARYSVAAKERSAKRAEEQAAQAADAQRLQAEEDETVKASGVEGTDIEETLRIMARVSEGDSVALLGPGIGHKPPCVLLVGGAEIQLKNAHTLVREKQTLTIVDPLTQEMGTRVTAVLDIMDGATTVSLEFGSAQNAALNAQGVEHLAQLCGAPH